MAQDDPKADPFASGAVAGASAGAWGSAPPADGPREDVDPFGVSEDQRYARGGVLGEGGMGRVWAARDARLGRSVALKETHGAPGLAARLTREASITAQLDHPGIVTVLDAGRGPEGRPFYTMQLVRGRSLDVALGEAEGLAERLRLLRRVLDACEAVAYAHDAGVVHRDLKPENIMLGDFGETRVVDWGLARRLDDGCAEPGEEHESPPGLTRAGAVMGTPAWMSPEQSRGEPADARSDVWSLGAVLYALVAGVTPRAEGQPRPLMEACPEAPPELAAVVERCMAEAPEQRYPDAGALAADLAAYVDGRRVHAHAYSPRELLLRFVQAWRGPLGVGAVALVLLAVAIGLGWWRTTLERDRAQDAEHQARQAEQATRSALARALAAQALAAAEDLSRTEAELLAARALTLEESPDARGVLAAFAGPRPQLIERRAGLGCSAAWFSPGRDRFVCQGAEGFGVWSVQPLEELWRAPASLQAAAFSQDGADLWIVDMDNRAQRRRADTGEVLLAARELAEAFMHGVRAQGGWLFVVNGDQMWQLSAADERLPPIPYCEGDAGVIEPLPDGDMLGLCRDGRAYRWTPGGPLQADAPIHWEEQPTWPRVMRVTPDGRRVLVAYGGDSEVRVIDLEARRPLTRLAADRGDLVDLSVSQDGRLAAVLGQAGGVRVLDLERLSWLDGLPEAEVVAVSFAPDGTLLALGEELQRWRMPEAPPAWQLRTAHGQSGLRFSADGARLGIATGGGSLHVFDRKSGALLWSYTTPGEVMKWADRDPETDGWWLAGMAFSSLRRLGPEGALVEERRMIASSTFRRVAALPGGWVLGLPHRTGLVVWSPGGPPEGVWTGTDVGTLTQVDVSADGRAALIQSMDGGLFLWTPEAGLRSLPAPGDVTAAALLDGQRALLALGDALGFYDLEAGALTGRIPVEGERTYRLAVSPDGRWAAVGDLSGGVRVWSLETGALKSRLRGHEHRVSGLDFSPDSRWLASASWDGSARIWDLSVLDRAPEAMWEEIVADWGVDPGEVGVE
ncbi:MAG: protein kinase [Alphaproteobacteria bacterium]|nr:protein kinase [Alphaproteobacteria bacterium]